MKYNKAVYATVFLIFSGVAALRSQDTISYSIEQAEATFLKKNLMLLAYQCNVDKQSALIIQSKAYPNPVFSANFNVYDPENDIYFHTDRSGQKDFMVEQLIMLGGKRKAMIDVAKTNKIMAEAELSDLLRNLKFQLYKSFYSIYQYQNNVQTFSKQMKLLDTLISSYEYQAVKGNLSLKDAIRLKSVYLKINNERAENILALNEENKNIQLLLRENGFFIPLVNNQTLDSYTIPLTLDNLESKAMTERPDLLISNSSSRLAELNYMLQRKANIPDAVFNVSTDQRGGAFRNQVNAGVSLPLPLWNYNRGNIRAARSDVQFSNYMLEERKNEIRSEVFEALQNMLRGIEEYNKVTRLYDISFENVFRSVNENFLKRNISIIEFVDFFEGYNDALTEMWRIKSQVAINAARINFVTGAKLY